MLLSLMLIGCGNTQPVQDTEDIALTEAPMEEEQVSPEEKTFDSLVKLDEGIYMMDCYTEQREQTLMFSRALRAGV